MFENLWCGGRARALEPGSLRYGVCRVLVSSGEQGGPGE